MVSPWQIRRAAGVLLGGGVIAYPTESVYGLGCNPVDHQSLERLLALKGRDADKGFILIAAEFAVVEPYVESLTPEMRRRVFARWPGPVTWLLPAGAGVPDRLTGGRDTIAVRVTAHPIAAALCRAVGGPIVSTSANRSGHRPATSPLGVRRIFGDRVDAVLHGPVGGGRPTEIRDARSDRIIRSA